MTKVLTGEYVRAVEKRYRGAKRSEKKRILDEFCEVWGYHRKHAIRVLNGRGKGRGKRAGRKPTYDDDVIKVVKRIWLVAEQICSKRLKEALPLWLPFYEQEYGAVTQEVISKILSLSASTIDRLLKRVRVSHPQKGLCGTKPGTLLRNQIPIRTNHWDVTVPGYLEADAVAHCGNTLVGSFIWSLTFTDIFSGWTENRATWNKGAFGVIEQIGTVESALVFPVLGFDCDNGSEFLNIHLWKYFAERPKPVFFTRSRPYRSNDNAHVEQKNWTHVRQLLGYDRLDNPDLVPLLNDLYSHEWGCLQNFFCPSMKLLKKERQNSKVRRFYEEPQTPFQRLMTCSELYPEGKQRLLNLRETLNPFHLRKAIERKLRTIFSRLQESI